MTNSKDKEDQNLQEKFQDMLDTYTASNLKTFTLTPLERQLAMLSVTLTFEVKTSRHEINM